MQITFSAQVDIAKGSISLILQNIAYNAARIAVVVAGLGAIALTAANFAGLLITIPVTWYYFKRYPLGKFDKTLMKDYLKVSLPFFIMGVCGTAIANLGRILLEHFDNVRQIGLYTAGYSIASMLLLISSTTGTIFFPLFSKQVAANQFELIKDQISRYEKFILQFILPAVILIALYSNFVIIALLGKRYFESGQILQILIISSFIQILIIPHGNLLVGLRLYKLVSYINIIQLIFFVISLLVFLPKSLLGLGAYGLSLSTLTMSILLAVLYYYYIRKKTNMKTIEKEHIVIFLWGTGLGLISNFTINYFSQLSPILTFVVGCITIPVLFYSLLYFFHLITMEDFKFLFRLFNIREIVDYIKAETKK